MATTGMESEKRSDSSSAPALFEECYEARCREVKERKNLPVAMMHIAKEGEEENGSSSGEEEKKSGSVRRVGGL